MKKEEEVTGEMLVEVKESANEVMHRNGYRNFECEAITGEDDGLWIKFHIEDLHDAVCISWDTVEQIEYWELTETVLTEVFKVLIEHLPSLAEVKERVYKEEARYGGNSRFHEARKLVTDAIAVDSKIDDIEYFVSVMMNAIKDEGHSVEIEGQLFATKKKGENVIVIEDVREGDIYNFHFEFSYNEGNPEKDITMYSITLYDKCNEYTMDVIRKERKLKGKKAKK